MPSSLQIQILSPCTVALIVRSGIQPTGAPPRQKFSLKENEFVMQWLIDSASHDLRHYLATIVANAEFLYETERFPHNRNEIFAEIRTASDQMNDLLESLRELARDDRAISPSSGLLDQVIRRAAGSALARPALRDASISLSTSGEMSGMFDAKKLERVFLNLFRNACEAALPAQCRVAAHAASAAGFFKVRVSDNGPGIPESIRSSLFEPFVSAGKSDGTGMGLAIVRKIIADHGGSVSLQSTSLAGTVFLIEFPRRLSALAEEEAPARAPGGDFAQNRAPRRAPQPRLLSRGAPNLKPPIADRAGKSKSVASQSTAAPREIVGAPWA